jgi:hypothetical protein
MFDQQAHLCCLRLQENIQSLYFMGQDGNTILRFGEPCLCFVELITYLGCLPGLPLKVGYHNLAFLQLAGQHTVARSQRIHLLAETYYSLLFLRCQSNTLVQLAFLALVVVVA